MHPVGQEWVDRHPDVVGENGDPRQCQTCHGTDYRGTVLSRVRGDRTLQTEQLGTKQFWRGFQVGCYTCHSGPHNSDRNPNRPAVVSDTSASTVAGAPIPVPLTATDADGDPLTLRIVSQPAHGTVALDGTQATYFPEAQSTGADSFTFAAWDGSTDSNLGTVSISVSDLPATATPTATETPAANGPPCVGDCNGDGAVTIDELITGTNIALGSLPLTRCTALDANADEQITVNELVIAVNATLNGCSIGTTPTATPLPTNTMLPTATPGGDTMATLVTIQSTIFTATCTDQFCHSGPSPAGGLSLVDGMSHDQLVGVSASNPAAQQAGLLRVKVGDPDNSFLLIKLTGPSPAEGSPMPLGKQPLTVAQLQLIRDWITAGALP